MPVENHVPTALVQLRQELNTLSVDLKKVLPPDITPDRFIRIVLTATGITPDLMNADRRSLMYSCLRCAQDGLLPDGREAALVLFKNQVSYLPMIRGVIKKGYQGGEILKWSIRDVRQNDFFEILYGDEEKIVHKPALKDRGEVIGVYSIAVLKSGEISREWMNVDEIEHVRQSSRVKNGGPWEDHYAEMCKKTVGHRHAKRLPMTPGLESVIQAIEENHNLAPQVSPPPQRESGDWLPDIEPKMTAEAFVASLKGVPGAKKILKETVERYAARPETARFASQITILVGAELHHSEVPEHEVFPFETEPEKK